MDALLPRLEFGADREEAEMSVILMHGLGADGNDFADVAQFLSESVKPLKWRFVLPHAPSIPVTINMGMIMPAWYDILDMSHPRNVDWETVEESQENILALVQNETASKILLAGFSQGGAMALHVGLRNQNAIDGILVMSGYLLESAEHPCPEKDSELPIGLFHGEADDVVPPAAAKESIKTLDAKGFDLSSKFYPGLGHSVSMDEIQDVAAWLLKVHD